jgi:hypothetical protein
MIEHGLADPDRATTIVPGGAPPLFVGLIQVARATGCHDCCAASVGQKDLDVRGDHLLEAAQLVGASPQRWLGLQDTRRWPTWPPAPVVDYSPALGADAPAR